MNETRQTDNSGEEEFFVYKCPLCGLECIDKETAAKFPQFATIEIPGYAYEKSN